MVNFAKRSAERRNGAEALAGQPEGLRRAAAQCAAPRATPEGKRAMSDFDCHRFGLRLRASATEFDSKTDRQLRHAVAEMTANC